MGELVDEQGEEIDQPSDDAVQPWFGPAQTVQVVGQDPSLGRDDEHEQREDEEEGQVEPNRDTEYLSDLDAVAAEESESHTSSI